jgi:hypothetical protein
MSVPRSAWDDVRARHPEGTHLLRVIDLEAKTQRFELVKPQDALGDYDLDGCTVVRPEASGRSAAELAAIIRDYDAAWYAARP